MKKILYITIIALAFAACNNGETKTENKEAQQDPYAGLHEKAVKMFAELPATAENPDNPLTEAKVKLGKILYFDKRLSKDETQSCNTCHYLATYGVDNQPTSKGDAGENGNRNSPTSLNSGLNFVQFWDGRSPDVEDQAGGPILNPVEMAIPDKDFLIKRLTEIEGYAELFKAAFPDDENPVTYENVQKAIGAFERTLNTPSKFDKYLAGDEEALTADEKAGLLAYMDAGCATCHSGALLGGNMFQKFGLFGNYWEYTNSETIDSGRYHVTGKDADMFVFKVPMLRNIDKTYPYFHDGSVNSLDESVKIMAKTELNKDLSEEETKSIVAFLATLTGELPDDVKAEPVMP
jgi:cytochrome c peroxidase